METINLFGASGHAKVVMDIIANQGNNIGCLYDDAPQYKEIFDKKVFNSSEKEVEGPLIITIGSNNVRKLISERYDCAYATAIYSSAIISPSAVIGEGSVIMPGVIINADTKVGKHCIINTGASIDHECIISDFVHIAPGCALSGCVQVGECSWIGVGSVIKQGIRIGKNVTIGAGSVVVKDMPDNVVAYGNPCKVMKRLPKN